MMKLVVQDAQAWLPKLQHASLLFLLPTKHKIFFLRDCFKILKKNEKIKKQTQVMASFSI